MPLLFLLFINLFIVPDETKILIGRSLEGRPIFLYRFGTGIQAIVIIAGIHGNEKNTADTAYYIINALHNGNITIPSDKSVFIVPEANPDGLSKNTRTNARKVDINRNFDTVVWKHTAPYHGTMLKCGDRPFSEPESKCIKSLFDKLIFYDFIPIYVSYHSQADSIIEGNLTDFNLHFASFLRNISKYKHVIDYPTFGDSEKWAAEKYGIPSATIEFKTKSESENDENERILQALLNVDIYEEFYKGFDIPVKKTYTISRIMNNMMLETSLETK
jgi:succinylglutamate desuccinylase